MIGLDPHLMTIDEAAKALGDVHVRTVYRLIARGDVAAITHARRTYIHRDAIADYFNRLQAEGNKRRLANHKRALAS